MDSHKTNMMSQPPAYIAPMAPPPQQLQQFQLLGPDPVGITCPNCRSRVVTLVDDMTTMKTHSFAVLLAVLGCFCGCCCIPYCTKSCLAQKHTCPVCRSMIGIYNN
ncbi:hypothetical protein ACKWTF_003406 [Chironomus riparius]